MKFMILETGEKITVNRVADGWKLNSPMIDKIYTRSVGLVLAELPTEGAFPLKDQIIHIVDLTELAREIDIAGLKFKHKQPEDCCFHTTPGLTFVYQEVEGGVIFNCAYLKPGENYVKRLGRYHATKKFIDFGGCFMPREVWKSFITA